MELIQEFVKAIIARSAYQELDKIYLTNRILALVGEDSAQAISGKRNLIYLKEKLVARAVKNGKIGSLREERDCLGSQLMDFITPLPSHLNAQFWSTYEISPQKAIADFYQLSQANDYIKVSAIAKNLTFKSPSPYGDMEITINLSKPEKNPKAIAAAKLAKVSSYPQCQLCMENEGYQGRIDYPARANHRIIRFKLNQQEWGFQYSPYAYFKEHCIFLDSQHRPMVISKETFRQLLAIVEIFPDYFAGSNADLPIVGGSILSHNHYQGGKHDFPMALAELEREFVFKGFPDIKAAILKWPMSVIRLQGYDSCQMVELAEKIRLTWRYYSDEKVDIRAFSGDQPHHTITPIARRREGLFELDLVLRDNHTSPEFPDGVYHPHKELQHIKKENIGLIEVMGLAILPPRLKAELKEVEMYLLGQVAEVADYHQEWADQLKASYQAKAYEGSAHDLLEKEVGKVFVRVLEDAGVYKMDLQGRAAFADFIKSVGIEGDL
ncbi:UDP-glucose--hexose-1-phosphate uridylyltransferase [Streptococcus didelphis]|uniref:UDP-glucose--hexose-1-phosphate uridylyltransferase n=1 Tax=Streptococcus didelphis TaxID=102886 RepID=UPI000368235C|nr:UDP-glucose--hexose-1-phosphate uridylyltransferase [Streptococcus didelphis]